MSEARLSWMEIAGETFDFLLEMEKKKKKVGGSGGEEEKDDGGEDDGGEDDGVLPSRRCDPGTGRGRGGSSSLRQR